MMKLTFFDELFLLQWVWLTVVAACLCVCVSFPQKLTTLAGKRVQTKALRESGD